MIDPLPLVAISKLASEQTKATAETLKAAQRCLDYLATFPNRTITYEKSDMVLYVHSDGTYLVEPEARSRAGGFFYLSNFIKDITKASPKLNGPIHVLCKILKNVVTSAAECEIASAFENGQDAIVIRRALQEMGHHQPSTPIQLDNTTATSFVHGTLKQNERRAST